MNVFHLAYTVTDLDSARSFYGELLGCQEGRSTDTWIDFNFFGNQDRKSTRLNSSHKPISYAVFCLKKKNKQKKNKKLKT